MRNQIIKNRAELYDYEYPRNFFGDFDYALGYAVKYAKSILDLGAGTGRVGFHLLNKGFDVTMVDNDPDMINMIVQKSRQQSAFNGKLSIVLNSMTTYKMADTYDMVLVLGNTFTSLLTSESQIKTLCNIDESLRKNGFSIILVYTPDLEKDSIDRYIYTYKFRIPDTSLIYHRYVNEEVDSDNGLLIYHFLYKVYDGAIFVDEFCNAVTTKIVSHESMEQLICLAGMRILDVNDGFTKIPASARASMRVYVIGKNDQL